MRHIKKFKDHELGRLYKQDYPSNLLLFDCETLPVVSTTNARQSLHYLRLWYAISIRFENGIATREQHGTGKDAESFWSFVHSRTDLKRPLWMFSHNLGFDLTVTDFWKLILNRTVQFQQGATKSQDGYEFCDIPEWQGMSVIDDPPTILKFRLSDATRTIIAVDTLNYFRTSLAVLGDSFRMDKAPMPAFDASDTIWTAYCRRDVEIILKAITSLIVFAKGNALGSFRMTAPSLAFTAFRTKFLDKSTPIYIHSVASVKALERKAYYGGLCQQWYCGEIVKPEQYLQIPLPGRANVPRTTGPVYHLDINSCYPFVMREHEYPTKLLTTAVAPGLSWLKVALDTSGVVADVRLDCKPPGYVVRHNGKTVRAYGRIYTCLCGPELKTALDRGEIRAIGNASVYSLAPIFRDYVNWFWEKRQRFKRDNNNAMAEACKLFLNSLFGKFSQWHHRWETQKNAIAPIPFGNWWDKPATDEETGLWRSLGWMPQKELSKREHYDSFTAISAYVTSYAREYIMSLIAIAKLGNCYYSDTDSIFCNSDAWENLCRAGKINPSELGALKQVSCYQTAEFRAPKDYTVDGKDVIAGLPGKAKRTSERRYEADKFAGIVETIQSKVLDGIAVTSTELDFSNHNPMGRVRPDGWVEPILLEMW